MQGEQAVEERVGRLVGPVGIAGIDNLDIRELRDRFEKGVVPFERRGRLPDAQHFDDPAATVQAEGDKSSASDADVPIVHADAGGVVAAGGLITDEDDGDAGGGSFIDDGAQRFGVFRQDHDQIDLCLDQAAHIGNLFGSAMHVGRNVELHFGIGVLLALQVFDELAVPIVAHALRHTDVVSLSLTGARQEKNGEQAEGSE